MKIRLSCLLVLFILSGCSQFNKGVIEKRELRKKKPPSVRIAEDYDKSAKKSNKTYKSPEQASRAREKEAKKKSRKVNRQRKKQLRKSR